MRLGHAAAVESFDDTENQKVNGVSGGASGDEPKWRKLNSTELGISNSKISKPTRKVLNGLKRKGRCPLLLTAVCIGSRELVS